MPKHDELPPSTTLVSAISSMTEPLQFFIKNMHLHPQIFKSGLLGFKAYVIHHPPFVRHVLANNSKNYIKFEKYRYLRFLGGNGLVTNEGQSWLEQRKLIQPAFNRNSIERAVSIMCQETQALIEQIGKLTNPEVDIAEAMGQLTINIAAKTLFSSDVGKHIPTIRSQLDFAQRLGNILLRIPLPLYSVVPYLPVFGRVTQCNRLLRGIIQEMIDARRAADLHPKDLLDDLMAARDDETRIGMTDEQLMDEVLTLLLAGHETTLVALTWAFYLIERHPEVYDRLRNEAMSVPHLDALRMSDLENLVWARAVAQETMRLFPPVYMMGRESLAEDQLGDFYVPAGTNVMINIYGLHRHPEWWEEPNEFRPERMLSQEVRDVNRCTYLPFGVGPRGCIGERFSMCELVIVLSAFARAFRFENADSRPAQTSPQFTLKAKRPIRMKLIRQ